MDIKLIKQLQETDLFAGPSKEDLKQRKIERKIALAAKRQELEKKIRQVYLLRYKPITNQILKYFGIRDFNSRIEPKKLEPVLNAFCALDPRLHQAVLVETSLKRRKDTESVGLGGRLCQIIVMKTPELLLELRLHVNRRVPNISKLFKEVKDDKSWLEDVREYAWGDLSLEVVKILSLKTKKSFSMEGDARFNIELPLVEGSLRFVENHDPIMRDLRKELKKALNRIQDSSTAEVEGYYAVLYYNDYNRLVLGGRRFKIPYGLSPEAWSNLSEDLAWPITRMGSDIVDYADLPKLEKVFKEKKLFIYDDKDIADAEVVVFGQDKERVRSKALAIWKKIKREKTEEAW